MAIDRELVQVCECSGPLEAQALRSSLEAYGIKPLVQGEHTSSVFGSLHGAAIRPRVFVPRADFALACRLAEEIVGSLGLPESVALPALENDPYRKRSEEAEDEDEQTNIDDLAEFDGEEESELDRIHPKKFRVALLIALFGLCFGFIHIYAERSLRGLILIATAAIGFSLMIRGFATGQFVIAGAMIFDVIVGGLELLNFNRQLAARKQAALHPAPDEQDKKTPALELGLKPSSERA